MKRIWTILFSYLLFLNTNAWAEAYIPKTDAEVLEQLPVAFAEKKRLRTLQNQAINNQKDYSLALRLAKNYIELGRANSDPRYYGYAEALLKPWLNPQTAQPDALVLRATILQNRHDFQPALADLKAALNLNPRLPEAWLTLAAIYEVQGEYTRALRSCFALTKFSTSLPSTICINSALSLSGQAQTAYQQLTAALAETNGEPSELTWAYNLLAELAERLALDKEAEVWYHKALSQHYRSVYLLACYSDFLLDHHRYEEVVKLLQNETQVDTLLLRLTLAEQQLPYPHVESHIKLMKDKMAAAKARGDTVHQGDESRFALQVLNEPKTALSLALSNWAVQKEPRDARILLEAALAAKQPDAAHPVIELLEATNLEDARLKPLLKLAKG